MFFCCQDMICMGKSKPRLPGIDNVYPSIQAILSSKFVHEILKLKLIKTSKTQMPVAMF